MNDQRGEGFLDKIKDALGMGDEGGSDTSGTGTESTWGDQEGTGATTGTTMDSGAGGTGIGSEHMTSTGAMGDPNDTMSTLGGRGTDAGGEGTWSEGTGGQAGYQGDRETTLTGAGTSEWTSSGSTSGSPSMDTDEDVIADGRQERGF